MATVYCGFDTMLEVDRAVKVLSPALCSKPKIRMRFLAEARAMAKLRHPNIVTIFDVGIDGETPYIVMEMVDGGAVMDWVDREGPLRPEVAGPIILGTLAGLQASHDRGIIHRDIKPHNVLITREGVVKITDYGIANMADDERSFTKTGAIMGTLAYMPPEQRSSAKGLGPTADVFATGASLFAILTGREPFDLYNETLHERLFAGIAVPLAKVIATACQYEPTERYASANAMRAALEAALGEVGVVFERDMLVPMGGASRHDGTMFFDGVSGSSSENLLVQRVENTTINPSESWFGASKSVVNDVGFATTHHGEPGRKRSVVLIGGVVAAVAVAVAVGLFLLYPERELVPDTTAPPVTEAVRVVDVVPVLKETPAVEKAPVPKKAAVKPPVKPKVVAPPVVQNKTPPVVPTPVVPEVQQPTVETPAPPEPGRLSVNAIPPSTVTIDGQTVGFGMVRGHALSAGSHRVVLATKDGRIKSLTATIRADEDSIICWSFEVDDVCPR
jgi:hypothetical protein